VNVKSNNHYAEHLLRIIGRTQNTDIYSDALQAGIDYVKKFWEQQGISTSSLTLHDGSGLAPQNAFSPAFLTEILAYMYTKSKNSKVFFDSLPKAGKDGTLRSFMRNTKYEGKISAKSGSIGGVQCYSGYLIDGNKQYAFTVMINKFNGTRSQVRSAIEKFLSTL
jgi:D-alanyl-D-alanine carboxypeptidase/D-alanyl-D-alanine-endopeptidase (penicillin-binding protein 4)